MIASFCVSRYCKTHRLLLNPTGCQDRTGGVHQPAANGAQVVATALPGALPQGVARHSHSSLALLYHSFQQQLRCLGLK